MSLSLSQSCSCIQAQTQYHEICIIADDMGSQSCFPKTERLILKYSKTLFLAYEWKTEIVEGEPYRSLVDMVFCNLYKQEQKFCLAFYQETGLKFRELYDEKSVKFVDLEMFRLLQVMVQEVKNTLLEMRVDKNEMV